MQVIIHYGVNMTLKPFNVTFRAKRRKGIPTETTHIIAHGFDEADVRKRVKLQHNRCNHMPEWRNYRFRIDSVTPHYLECEGHHCGRVCTACHSSYQHK